MPMEVLSAACPLPGIGVGGPRHIHMMQLEVTLTGVPGTLPIREEITYPFHWRRRRWWMFSHARDANGFINVDQIRVHNVIVGNKTLQAYLVVSSYSTQRIAAHDNVHLVATRTRGLRENPKYVRT